MKGYSSVVFFVCGFVYASAAQYEKLMQTDQHWFRLLCSGNKFCTSCKGQSIKLTSTPDSAVKDADRKWNDNTCTLLSDSNTQYGFNDPVLSMTAQSGVVSLYVASAQAAPCSTTPIYTFDYNSKTCAVGDGFPKTVQALKIMWDGGKPTVTPVSTEEPGACIGSSGSNGAPSTTCNGAGTIQCGSKTYQKHLTVRFTNPCFKCDMYAGTTDPNIYPPDSCQRLAINGVTMHSVFFLVLSCLAVTMFGF